MNLILQINPEDSMMLLTQTSRHYKKHSRPYRCQTCNTGFALNNDLVRHRNARHQGAYRPFRCKWPGCESPQFSRSDQLKKHMFSKHARQAVNSSQSTLQDIGRLYEDSLAEQKLAMQPVLVSVALKGNDSIEAESDFTTLHHQEQLHRAARLGDESLLTFLLDKGVDINLRTQAGETAVYLAIQNGHEQMALHLIAKGADHSIPGCAEKHGNRKTVLGLALEKGQATLAELLLQRGAEASQETLLWSLSAASRSQHEIAVKWMLKRFPDVAINHPNDYCRETVLHAAASAGNTSIITALLNGGADIAINDRHNQTVLHYLLKGESGSKEASQLPIHHRADVNAKAHPNYAPLLKTVTLPNLDAAIRLLVANGADVNAKGGWPERSPLEIAARLSCPENAIRCLLDLGAVPSPKVLYFLARNPALEAEAMLQHLLETSWGSRLNVEKDKKVLYNAIQNKVSSESALRRVRLLIDHGADCFARSKGGKTLLHSVTQGKNRKDIIRLLLEKGLELEDKDDQGRTALIAACQHDDPDVDNIESLIHHGADVFALDNERQTVLFGSSTRRLAEVAESLIGHGVDVKARNYTGQTALFAASPDVAKVLIDCGADVNARDNKGQTALFRAVRKWNRSVDTAKVLIEHGVAVNARDNTGQTALFTAVSGYKRSADTAKVLIEGGADVNARDNTGKTALFMAPRSAVNVELLIECGADVNARDNKGQTALFEVVGPWWPDMQVAKLLIRCGADVDIRDANGKTLLMAARGKDMKSLIKSHLDGALQAGKGKKL